MIPILSRPHTNCDEFKQCYGKGQSTQQEEGVEGVVYQGEFLYVYSHAALTH